MGRRRGGCVLMALGIFLAVIGGGVAFWLVNNAVNRPPPVEIPKKSIYVAKVLIPERTQLSPALVDKADWPVNIIPADTVSATAKIDGQFTTEQIRPGQPLLTKQLIAGSAISYTVYPWPVGKVIVAVPFPKASELMGAGVLKEGSVVDLILNIQGKYVLGRQNLRIFAIGELERTPIVDKEGKVQPAPATKSTLFLFNETPEDALTLKFLSDLNPDFWVRSPLESSETQFNIPVVDASYIAQKFRLQGVGLGTTPPGQPAPGAPGAPR